MSPNWLSAIGRAQPAITQTMQDMQERPKEKARWGFEQEKMGMEREQSRQREAINKITLDRMEFDQAQRKKEQERLANKVDIKTDMVLSEFEDEDKTKFINYFKSVGWVDKDDMWTVENQEKSYAAIRTIPGVFEVAGHAKTRRLKRIVDEAQEKFIKVRDTPGVEPKNLKEATDKYVAASEIYNSSLNMVDKGVDLLKKQQKYGNLLKKLNEDGIWKTLDERQQKAIMTSMVTAIETGNEVPFNEVMKDVFNQVKESTEKSANIQFKEDDKGNTVKIVSHPVTGQTMRIENMGKIGKVTGEKEKTFKDKQIEAMWPKLSEDEKKKFLGAGIDPHELTEKNILDMYGNIMTDPTVRKSIQPIAEDIIKRATEKPKPSSPTEKVLKELPKGAKLQGYGADGKKIYEIPPAKPGGKPTYMREQ